jgi:hypothetical protein
MNPIAIWIKTHPLYLAAPCLIGVLLFWRQTLMIVLFAAWTIAAAIAQVQRRRATGA